MPPVIAGAVVAGGIAGTSAVLTTGLSLAVFGSAFGTAFFSTLVIGGLSQALIKKPRFDSLNALAARGGQTVSVRSAADSVKLIYGETRVGGTIVHLETTGDDKLLHIVVTLAGHEVDSIGDVYLGDGLLSSSRYHKGTYSNIYVWIRPYGDPEDNLLYMERPYHMEGLDKVWDSGLIYDNAFEDWETVFELTGTANNNDGIYRRVITGQHDCALDYVRLERIDGGSVTYEDATDVTIDVGYAWAYKHLGATDQVADPNLVAVSDDWSASDQLRGIAYLYLRLAWNSQVFPEGLENISAVVKGKKVYDPYTATTAWSDNAALCVADYLTDSVHGIGADYATEIDETALIAARHICNESVARVGLPDEARYTCNGVIDTAVDVQTNLGAMLSAMGGLAVFSSGVWHLLPAAYRTPTVTLDEDDLIDTVQVQTRIPRRELFNAVKGLFVSPQEAYQPADFPAQVSTTYATEDGATLFRDMDLAFTNSPTMAQRLARIELLKIRQQIAVQIVCKLPALKIRPGDVINLTNTRLGWSAKPFEVREWSLTYDADQLGVALGLRETAAAIYDWNTGIELPYDIAPDTNLPNPFSVYAPYNFAATSGGETLFVQADGTVITRVKVTWSQANASAVAFYELSYQQDGADFWTDVTTLTPLYYISPAKDGDTYHLRVRAVNHFGVRSLYVYLNNHVVLGKTDPPPDVTSFLVQRLPDGTREFTWTLNSPPIDLDGFVIRYQTGTGGTWETMTPLHTGVLKASPFETNLLAAGTYTVGIKAVDTSGNESQNAKIVESTLGDPRLSGALYYADLNVMKYPGTKTNCAYDQFGRLLVPGSDDTWSSIPGNKWTDWNAWNVDPVSQMQYVHSTIDLTAVLSFKVLASATIPSGTVTIEEQHSDDNVSYSSYAAVGAQITARYVRVRITVNNPHVDGITQASIIIDANAVNEMIQDLVTSTISSPAGDLRLPITKAYSSIWVVNLALQNVGSGWTWEIIDKNPTLGPRVKIYNASGTLADATIDAEIKGL